MLANGEHFEALKSCIQDQGSVPQTSETDTDSENQQPRVESRPRVVLPWASDSRQAGYGGPNIGKGPKDGQRQHRARGDELVLGTEIQSIQDHKKKKTQRLRKSKDSGAPEVIEGRNDMVPKTTESPRWSTKEIVQVMRHTSKVTEVGGNQKVDEYMEWRAKPKTKDNRQPKNDGPKETNGQGIRRTKDSVAPEGKEGQIMGAQRQRRGKVTGGPSHGVPTITENQKEMRSSKGRLPEPVMDKVNRGPRRNSVYQLESRPVQDK
ncbi:hypothetical protein DFH28DRAFT_929090 [Melampsora americana]|nr:hypothetical protein DFH28DRAFT_929090 [Melampsora americana]